MHWKETLIYPAIGPLLKAAFKLWSWTRLPPVKGSLALDGLDAPAEILRDRWGVAHIFAASERDALYAQGFVHAQERLWQMEVTRRIIDGRLAEILGEGALPFDRSFRTLGLYRVAEEEAGHVPAGLEPLLQAYCAGANAWMERAQSRHQLPVEFSLLEIAPDPWRIADILKWEKLMCWTLASNWQSEFMRGRIVAQAGAQKAAELEIAPDQAWAVVLDAGRILAAGRPADATAGITGPNRGQGAGSNNWVVASGRSSSGQPLRANDMHLGLTSPSVWFENHLVGGGLDVSGVSVPGVPLVIGGHNRSVAWGFTAGCSDVQDLYEEHIRPAPDGGREYEFKGEGHPAEVRRETIRIRGGGSETREVVVTRHGPIVNALFEEAFPDVPPLALRWTAFEPEATLQAVYDMNHARDCREFKKALAHFHNPAQNTVYADTQGNIAYTLTGKTPIRARGDGSVPSPGWTGEYEWTGYIPYDEMPHLFNPERGYIASANNQIQPEDFPHFIGRDYLISDRAGRIVELLESREKVDPAYFRMMQVDQISISARRLAGCLGRLETADPDLAEIAQAMRSWDGNMAAGSRLAAISAATVRCAVGLLLKARFGDLGVFVQGKGPAAGQWGDHAWEWFIRLLDRPDSPWFDLGHGEKRDDVLRLALRQAVDLLRERLGVQPEKWAWGRIHRLTVQHVLGYRKPLNAVFNLGPYPMGGDDTTIWAAYTSLSDLSGRVAAGPPFRFVADLGDLDHCQGQLLPGPSGNLASRHHADGVKPWFEGKFHPMLVRREEIERNLEARLALIPKKQKSR